LLSVAYISIEMLTENNMCMISLLIFIFVLCLWIRSRKICFIEIL